MRYFIIFSTFLFLNNFAFSQGIRKDWTEMTNDERDALISAYWELGDDIEQDGHLGGLIEEMGDFHRFNFSDIHFNSPVITPELDVFLAWHRQASVELQRAMKNQLMSEWITIPYWDWTLSNSKSDALWGDDWLGPFDTAWSLNRLTDDDGGAPTQITIDNLLNRQDFILFTSLLETSSLHFWGHSWTGGTMDWRDSPKDPVFFFHHNMVDKIWADWYERHGDCPGGCYVKTDMPRYDDVDPDGIVDPRILGIFYSDRINSLTTLDKYTVSNDNAASEKFGYQYRIEAKDNFLVPLGKNAEFRSCNVVCLLPGFEASYGSVFCSRIDEDCNFSTNARITGKSKDSLQSNSFKNSPNPFSSQTNIEFILKEDKPVTLTVFDATGKEIAKLLSNNLKLKGSHQVKFDVGEEIESGIYYCTLIVGDHIETQKMMLTK